MALHQPLSSLKGYDGRDLVHRIAHTGWDVPHADRDQILHQIRGKKEGEHRDETKLSLLNNTVFSDITGGKYEPFQLDNKAVLLIDQLRNMVHYYNKSAMIYYVDKPGHSNGDILKFVDIWLYRHWFEPYKSDIDFGRYIAKTTSFYLGTDRPKPSLDDLKHYHKRLCHDLTGGNFRNPSSSVLEILKTEYLYTLRDPLLTKEDIITAFNQSYILQSTFESFFIVMQGVHEFTEGPFRADDVGNIPVYLVCTDCHDRFHSRDESKDTIGPCCSIQTTFKAAIRFIMNLEKKNPPVRKILPGCLKHVPRSFYCYPNSIVTIEEVAASMGWDTAKHGEFPVDQPCSTWVDTKKYTEWTGAGAITFAGNVVHTIMNLETTKRKVPMEDHWWWYGFESEKSGTRMYRLQLMFVLAYAVLGTVLALGVISFWLLCWIGWIEE
ncbi:hypothetical protein ACHAPO_010832 [Fusarium lateritium]